MEKLKALSVGLRDLHQKSFNHTAHEIKRTREKIRRLYAMESAKIAGIALAIFTFFYLILKLKGQL